MADDERARIKALKKDMARARKADASEHEMADVIDDSSMFKPSEKIKMGLSGFNKTEKRKHEV